MNTSLIDLGEVISKACRRLLDLDPEIIEIIVFGSTIYAPIHARDVDLLVITKCKKDYLNYIKAIEDLPIDIDLVVFNAGEKPRNDLLINLFLGYKVLYGSGKVVKEWLKYVNIDVEEVYSRLRIAKKILPTSTPNRKQIR